MSNDRLNPENKGNAKLLFIDGDEGPCDICDEVVPHAVFETIGSPKMKTCILICKKCLQETIKRFDN